MVNAMRQFNKYVVQTLTGVLADNAANDSGDMIRDVTALAGNITVGGVTVAASAMNPDAILEAQQTMGDKGSELALLIMHSRLATNLKKQNLISFIPNARGEIKIPTYLGYQVLVTDTCPAVVSGSDLIYTSYLLANGALGFAEHLLDKPVETDYFPAKGNGVGVEELWTRRQFALHP